MNAIKIPIFTMTQALTVVTCSTGFATICCFATELGHCRPRIGSIFLYDLEADSSKDSSKWEENKKKIR